MGQSFGHFTKEQIANMKSQSGNEVKAMLPDEQNGENKQSIPSTDKNTIPIYYW